MEGFVLTDVAASLACGRSLATKDCDVLLLDLALPDGSGLDLIRELRAQGKHELKIIVISVFGDVKNVVNAIEAGADGYLLKGGEPTETERAIRDVLVGGAPISPAVAGHILARLRAQPTLAPLPSPSITSLTDKETEILTE